MIRVKRGNVGQKRRKKIIKLAKGFVGAGSRLFRVANQRVMKSFVSAYSGLKRRTRKLKKNWICRINGVTRQGLFPARTSSYSKLRHVLKKCKSKLNAKMLSQLSILDILSFHKILWVLNPRHFKSHFQKWILVAGVLRRT
jgi:large subunit ribosomal protein L20